MEVITPGLLYRIFYYNNKDKYIDIPFFHKEHKTIKVIVPGFAEIMEDGVIEFVEGVGTEELLYLLLDRFKYLNDKHYSTYNDQALQGIKQAIGAMKDRKKNKKENQKKYQESFNNLDNQVKYE